jgi:ADP-dependent NAD(P)H-hydrate dehydratase / NAD(P)H-hydrate epimerase
LSGKPLLEFERLILSRTTIMKIVSASEMREVDRATSEQFGVPSATLMENAGTAVADFVVELWPTAKRIGVICGKGNNGGDGFVAARKLKEAGREVHVLLLAQPSELRGDAAQMFSKLPVRPVVATSSGELTTDQVRSVFDCELLLDAILGTGFRPPVSGLYGEAIAHLNKRNSPVVAVDIPSGADADVMGEQTGAVARADGIGTFTAPRPAHVFGGLTHGVTRIAPIGSPEEAVCSSLHLNLITARDIAPLVAPRPAAANKGNFGHALIVGGSVGKAGAAAMAGISALRVGAGLSTVATPKSVLSTVAGFHPEIMTEPLPETAAGTVARNAFDCISNLAKGMTVIAIGPGVSRNPETSELVRELVKTRNIALVLDADGLNAFADHREDLNGKSAPLVLTPHPGEMARLTGLSIAAIQHDRINVARTYAREHGLVLVLKGHRTLIADSNGEVWVNTTGNPGMATGGTGDILTGMTAGFIAQNPSRILEAVLAAVHFHGLAGDMARETLGEHSLIATDLITALPKAFFRVRDDAEKEFVELHG